MRKVITGFLSLCSLFSLCSCRNNKVKETTLEPSPSISGSEIISPIISPSETPSVTPSITVSPTDLDYSKDLVITEIFTGSSVLNRAVEISNVGDFDLSLENYSLLVYRNFSDIYDENIPLKGIIKKKSSYVVAYKEGNKVLLDKADLIVDNYMNNGSFPVALAYKNFPFDSVGKIGYNYDFAKNATLVRKQEYFDQTLDFEAYHWIRYPFDNLDTLGNYNCVSEEELFKGPRLTQENFDTPFALGADEGSGGVIPVTLSWTSDGDTSGFNYGSTFAQYDIAGSLSTRYYGVNTPEIAHSAGEVSDPYGDEAKEFTNAILKKARRIVIQSVAGYVLHETYGRMLGYVWVSDKTNPNPEDYQLMSHLIIQNGYSHPAFLKRSENYNHLMNYNGIDYIEYLYDMENYATLHKINIYSED